MAGETSWISPCDDAARKETAEVGSFKEPGGESDSKSTIVPLDLLDGDVLEHILTCLPIASIFRAGCVSTTWHKIVTSESFLKRVPPQEPWYFMFTSSDEPIGYAYDPDLRKWYAIELPCIESSNWFIATSCGMACFMDNDCRSQLYVCNPITKKCRKLEEPPGLKFSDYSTLAISVNRKSGRYKVAIVKSKQTPENFIQWDISIHIYNSMNKAWVTSRTEVLMGWRGGDESVICNGVLYFLAYSTGGVPSESRHALIGYNISQGSSQSSLTRNFIPIPCTLTCGRLINLKEKLVMVGGIGRPDRPDIIKGIGIWLLNDGKWEEIARMPHKYFQGFGELDDVFACSGAGDLIYIQSYGAPILVIFDMNHKQWKWSQKYPVTKKFPLQLFTGFCFEPRLEIVP